MKESVMNTLTPALISALFVVSAVPAVAQQEFPVAATIRGENIWLRIEPAEETEIVAYLQRGDQVRVTGEATAADGDAFYPVRVTETGETGWVRDLAIDPRSFAAPATLPEVVIDEPPVEEDINEPEPRNTRPRGGNRNADNGLSISGFGLEVSDTFTLEPGRYQATATVNVTGSFDGFAAYLHGPGGYRELLFNETIEGPQQWTAESIVATEVAGEYFLEAVNTESEWTIELALS
jgi:hypothetical protein